MALEAPASSPGPAGWPGWRWPNGAAAPPPPPIIDHFLILSHWSMTHESSLYCGKESWTHELGTSKRVFLWRDRKIGRNHFKKEIIHELAQDWSRYVGESRNLSHEVLWLEPANRAHRTIVVECLTILFCGNIPYQITKVPPKSIRFRTTTHCPECSVC